MPKRNWLFITACFLVFISARASGQTPLPGDSSDRNDTSEWEEYRTPTPSDTISGRRWLVLLRAWDAYLNYPSTENAVKAYDAIPQGKTDSTEWDWSSFAVDSIGRDMRILEYNALASDRNAVRLQFGLLAIADGDFAEALCMDLGSLIRINPRLFLEEFHNHSEFIILLDGIVGNFGEEYVDLIHAQCLEQKLRISALRQVDVYNLNDLRDKCIQELKTECR